MNARHEQLLNDFNEKVKQNQLLEQRYSHIADENKKLRNLNNELDKN